MIRREMLGTVLGLFVGSGLEFKVQEPTLPESSKELSSLDKWKFLVNHNHGYCTLDTNIGEIKGPDILKVWTHDCVTISSGKLEMNGSGIIINGFWIKDYNGNIIKHAKLSKPCFCNANDELHVTYTITGVHF